MAMVLVLQNSLISSLLFVALLEVWMFCVFCPGFVLWKFVVVAVICDVFSLSNISQRNSTLGHSFNLRNTNTMKSSPPTLNCLIV